MTFRLEPLFDGPENAETILFVQGWPDDSTLWDEAVAALRGEYRCVRVNLPNYRGGETAPNGYSTEQIVDALVELYRRLGAERPFTLVLHDWGCYWGHVAHHRCPELIKRVVGCDVAPHFTPDAKAAAGIVLYQFWLWGAFALRGSIGTSMTRGFARVGGVPKPLEQLDASMNYPYRNVWQDIFSGRIRKLTHGYWPKCPLLFIYGERKPFPFHSKAWLDHVRSTTGGEVVGLPSNHWVQRDPAFVPTLAGWLSRTK